MPDSAHAGSTKPSADHPPAAVPPRRGPGHRADARDTVAELAEKAQLISLEAGSKVAAAMKDVISAAVGLAGFAIESARDLTNYMVRRGQMTQDEADKLLREAEAAHSKRPASERGKPTATKIAAEKAALAKAQAARAAEIAAAAFAKLHPPRPPKPPSKVFMPKPVKTTKAPAKKVSKKASPRTGAKKSSKPSTAKKPTKKAVKKPAARKPAPHKAAKKRGGKPTARKPAARKSPAKKKR
jgi:polyhydroxyalkanoate synthesis regulator phasin